MFYQNEKFYLNKKLLLPDSNRVAVLHQYTYLSSFNKLYTYYFYLKKGLMLIAVASVSFPVFCNFFFNCPYIFYYYSFVQSTRTYTLKDRSYKNSGKQGIDAALITDCTGKQDKHW